jgi:hypothetical protein
MTLNLIRLMRSTPKDAYYQFVLREDFHRAHQGKETQRVQGWQLIIKAIQEKEKRTITDMEVGGRDARHFQQQHLVMVCCAGAVQASGGGSQPSPDTRGSQSLFPRL